MPSNPGSLVGMSYRFGARGGGRGGRGGVVRSREDDMEGAFSTTKEKNPFAQSAQKKSGME